MHLKPFQLGHWFAQYEHVVEFDLAAGTGPKWTLNELLELDAGMDRLHEFTSARAIQLVSDEVYHPIYHGPATRSASRLPRATVIHDFSKAFPISGVRTGWIAP